jgi:hypothetical protein
LERDTLRQAVTDHLVLCIRGQVLSPTELAEASSLFGEPKTFVLRKNRVDDAPEVSIVSNRPPLLGGKPLVQAKHWHTDFLPGRTRYPDPVARGHVAAGWGRYGVY